MNIVSRLELSSMAFITYIKKNQVKVKMSSRADIWSRTEWDQDNRNKTGTKISLTGEVMNRGEANIPINLTKVHAIILFNEEIHYLLLRSYKSVTSINHLVNITRVAREPELF